MSTTAPSISRPLSDAEYDALADVLEAHSPFDLDGVTGLLHAVVIAPSMMPPSTWLPRVLPDGLGSLEDARSSLQLLMRLYNEVVGGLAKKMVLMPEATEVDACESFAAGFVAGAELDPEWLGDPARWTFASWAAYLAGRLDLVPPSTLVKLAGEPEESQRMIRRDMGGIILAADDSFKRLRREPVEPPRATQARTTTRIGRNDPCPCASGKKYKRCCVDRARGAEH